MAGGHDSLAALFRELTELTILEEGSPNSFRARAYEKAMQVVASHRGELRELSEKQLTALDGIGASTAKKIREFFESGTIAKLEELRQRYPRELVELGKIPGLGPKTLLRLRSALGVQNLQDLRAALEGQKVRGVAGLGEKLEQKLLAATARMGETGKDQRRPIAEAMPIARELVQSLEALPGVERAAYCGSLRRLRETVADVDIVAAARDAAPVREAFLAMPWVRDVIGSGDTKTSVFTAIGLQVDLRIVEPRQFGAACQYFTGSKAHNIKLRQRALDRGLLLNEYALSRVDTGEVVASETEEDMYRALDLPFIPPPMREDCGEIEAAEAGELPRALSLADMRGDLHVHTSLSGDGRSTLEEILTSAAERGYTYLALTDHAENLAMSGATREELAQQRVTIDALRASFPGLALLHGSELNVGRDGSLDYDLEFRRTLEWCVAGVHSHFDLPRDEQTRRILRAMEDPTVDAIAHLSGRRIGRRPGIELDVDAVLRKAIETDTAIEINASLARLDAASDVLQRARGMDVTFVISTDTHHTREFDRMQWGVLQAARGFVDPARVANTWPRERFLGWVRSRRARASA
jgi:DNA polymerase (family 10)